MCRGRTLRSSLHALGHSEVGRVNVPRSDTGPTRPQPSPKRLLQPDDRHDVRPAESGQYIGDSLPIHPARRRGLPQTPSSLVNRSTQSPGDVLHDSDGGILGDRIGPPILIRGKIARSSRTAYASGHPDALLSITVHDDHGYLSSHWEWTMQIDDDTAARIRAYRPELPAHTWARLRQPVIALVTAVAPLVPYGVDDLLYATSRIAAFADSVGMQADPSEWLRNETIDRFTICGCSDQAPATAMTYRTYLRRMREAVVWVGRGEAPSPRLRGTTQTSEPYDGTEQAALDTWADGLPERRRLDAHALLCLGGGCGLTPGQIVCVRSSDVRALASEAVIVSVPGTGRIVACRARYEGRLRELADARPDQWLFRPGRTVDAAKNLISNWTRTAKAARGVPSISARRLRSTWIVALMTDRVDRELIARVASLSSSAQLAKYAKWVPALTDDAEIRLLRGPAWE